MGAALSCLVAGRVHRTARHASTTTASHARTEITVPMRPASTMNDALRVTPKVMLAVEYIPSGNTMLHNAVVYRSGTWWVRWRQRPITLVEALRLASDRLRLVRRLAVAPGGFAL